MRKGKKIKISKQDRIYLFLVYLFLGIFILCVTLSASLCGKLFFFRSGSAGTGKVFFLPVDPGITGIQAVFQNAKVWRGYGNTIFYTVAGTAIGVAVSITASYVLSRKEFPLHKFLSGFFMFTMFFGGGTIPTYLWLKSLGMLNTIWAIVLPGAVNVWLVMVGRTFLQSSIPEELFEAVCLDGGNYFQYFFKIILPLSKPILAVLALNFALVHWNSYYSALLYLSDAKKYPLQIVLREILIQNTIDLTSMTGVNVNSMMKNQYLSELLKYSLIIVSSVPLLVIYPFIQKYFIKGVMIGSVKG